MGGGEGDGVPLLCVRFECAYPSSFRMVKKMFGIGAGPLVVVRNARLSSDSLPFRAALLDTSFGSISVTTNLDLLWMHTCSFRSILPCELE